MLGPGGPGVCIGVHITAEFSGKHGEVELDGTGGDEPGVVSRSIWVRGFGSRSSYI